MKLFIPSALILNLLGAGPSSLMLPFTLEKSFTVDMYGYLMSVETAASLPEENRGALLGFISAASTGGCALSAVIFGVLGDVFPLYLVFTVGCLLTIPPMAYMCLHKHAREYVLTH